MQEKLLKKIVEEVLSQKCETNHVEIKKAEGGCPKIFDTLSSFSNQKNGGIILFGIDEENDFKVCGVYDAADIIKNISEQCLQMEPPVNALCTTTSLDGKTIVCAEIPEMDDFQKFAIELREKKPNVASLPVERQMYLLGFLADKHPTVAGLLMFGVYPQGFLPNLCITAVIVPGTEMSSTGDVGERFIAFPKSPKARIKDFSRIKTGKIKQSCFLHFAPY